jgi:hypothetical protein
MIGVTNNDTDLHFLSRTGGVYSKAMTIDGATGNATFAGNVTASNLPESKSTGESFAFGTNAGSAFLGDSVNKINVAIGSNAGTAMADYGGNVFIGKDSAKLRTRGDNNVAIGTSAGGVDGDDFGDKNVFIGLDTGKNINSINADSNVMIGNSSGTASTVSISNILIGDRSGNTLTDSRDNVAIGTLAGTGNGVTNTTTGNGVYIGYYARSNATNANNEIVIGSEATGHGTDTVTIGDSQITGNYFNGDVIIKSVQGNDNPATINLWSPDTSIVADDTFGTIIGQASDSGGSPPYTGAKIEFNADATWDTGTPTYHASRIDFFTQSNAGADALASPRMTIDSSGNSTFAGNITVNGDTLSVVKSNNNAFLKIESTDGGEAIFEMRATTNRTNQIRFFEGATQRGSIVYAHASQSLTFNTGDSATSKLVLDDNSRISLSNNDSGTSNTVFGKLAGNALASGGDENVLIGDNAGNDLTTGDKNVIIGSEAGDNLTLGTRSVAIGSRALGSEDVGDRSIAIGFSSLFSQNSDSNNESTRNIGIGTEAGFYNITGQDNTFIGNQAGMGASGQSNSGNTAIGSSSLNAITDGANNVAIGYQSGDSITTESNCTLIGKSAGSAINNATANGATGVGSGALLKLTNGRYNTAVGYQASSENLIGWKNTSFGYQALYSALNDGNTGIGYRAGTSLTSGTNNVAIGSDALDGMLTGVKNTSIGAESMGSADGAEEQNVAIGYKAMFNNNNGSSNTCIGSGTLLSTAAGQGQIAIGRDVACIANETVTIGFGSNVASLGLDGSDTSWAASSDERLKENIADATAGLDVINDLRPVTYNWKKAKDIDKSMPQYKDSDEPVLGKEYGESLHGFIAQEVKVVIDKHDSLKEGFKMWKQSDDGTQTIADGNLIPILVKAVQELSAKVKELESK